VVRWFFRIKTVSGLGIRPLFEYFSSDLLLTGFQLAAKSKT
jgi:hypothetical protein